MLPFSLIELIFIFTGRITDLEYKHTSSSKAVILDYEAAMKMTKSVIYFCTRKNYVVFTNPGKVFIFPLF